MKYILIDHSYSREQNNTWSQLWKDIAYKAEVRNGLYFPPDFSHTYVYRKKINSEKGFQFNTFIEFFYTFQWLTQHLLKIHILKFASISEVQFCTAFLEYNYLQGRLLVLSSGLCRDSNGFWNLLCIQTRCIFTFFFLFTCNRRSTKFCTSVSPATVNMFHTSSIFSYEELLQLKKKKVICRI